MKKFLAISAAALAAAGTAALIKSRQTENKIKIKLLFIPKFESGEMTGDAIGEAQLFYEAYCMESEKFTLANGYPLYVNRKNGVAIGLTHAGKANAYMFTTAVLCDSRFDFSEAYIMCIGCAGSAYGASTMGDISIISETVDFDLGYQSTAKDENGNITFNWFDNPDTADHAHIKLNRELVDWAYNKTKDIKLETTEITMKTLSRNYPGEAWCAREPKVVLGTVVTSDEYWKGEREHNKALQLVDYYKCADPFTVAEMEDNACAVVAQSFGMLDRFIAIRASVNLDLFLDNATAVSTWGEVKKYEESVHDGNDETLDIFDPAMRNMFAVGRVIADAILDGSLLK